jgi:hypothetical protein
MGHGEKTRKGQNATTAAGMNMASSWARIEHKTRKALIAN